MGGQMSMSLTASQIDQIEREAERDGLLGPYRELVSEGTSPRLALMLVSQRFPAVKGTDAVFNKLQRHQMASDFTDYDRERIVAIAKRAGIDTTGKTYNGQLGTYSDPLAWVSGTHDVRKTAAAKGLSLRGQVNVVNEPKPIERKLMSDRLLAETESEYLAADPALAQKVRRSKSARQALREKIIAKHAAKRR